MNDEVDLLGKWSEFISKAERAIFIIRCLL